MNGLVQNAVALKDVGIALVLVIVIYLTVRQILGSVTDWIKINNEGKKERAEIYTKPLDKLGDEVGKLNNTLERLDTNVCNLAEDRRYNTEMLSQMHLKICGNNKSIKKEAIGYKNAKSI